MKYLCAFLFCLLLFPSMSRSQTQVEMNQEAARNLRDSDKKLNATYQKILSLYAKNPKFIMNLKAAQQLWIQFRDGQVAMMYPGRSEGYYGSVLPMCKATYPSRLTDARTTQLEEWANAPQESSGDVCSGTIGEFESTE